MNSNEMAKLICETLVSKKGQDIVKIDVRDKTILADYFIITSGKSGPSVKALANYAIEAVEKEGGEVRRVEGMSTSRWVVVDFGDVILHVFHDETRLFYNLERLWVGNDNVEKFED